MTKKRRTYEVVCGSEVMYDGSLVRVEGIAGTHITLRDVQANTIMTVSMVRFIEAVHPADPGDFDAADLAFSLSSSQDHEAAAKLARQLRFVIYGTDNAPAGDLSALPGVENRRKALAKKLDVTTRTVSRWMSLLRKGGEAALISATVTRKRRSRVDPRWETQLNITCGQITNFSTYTRDYVMEIVEDALVERFGAGVVPIPSTTTQYEKLKIIDQGRNLFTGSAKGRRSISDVPKKTFGRLRATRPGQYAILDTTPLDC